MSDIIQQIDKRYTELADDSCCLSCGGAIDKSEVKSGEVCVDLGSGRGTDALRMAETVGSEGFVYGVDISEGMIKKARKTAKKMGVENVKFIMSELESIPIPTNSVDLVISNCVLNHVENKQRVWKEIFRMLKEGGRFVISDIYSSEEVPEKYKNDPEAVAECWAGASTKEVYMAIVKVAGFKNVEILEESAPYKKGEIEVSSFTIAGVKNTSLCCCG